MAGWIYYLWQCVHGKGVHPWGILSPVPSFLPIMKFSFFHPLYIISLEISILRFLLVLSVTPFPISRVYGRLVKSTCCRCLSVTRSLPFPISALNHFMACDSTCMNTEVWQDIPAPLFLRRVIGSNVVAANWQSLQWETSRTVLAVWLFECLWRLHPFLLFPCISFSIIC
jgi:hypothetical protein